MTVAFAHPGTLESENLARLVAMGHVRSQGGIGAAQVQPASLDLTLGEEGFRLPGSLLPLAGESVRSLAEGFAVERIDLRTPRLLARNHVYLVRLREACALPPGLEGYANGKSSTGRVDLATRVLSDGCPRYDRIPAGYTGDLWIELIPRSFDVVVEAGVSLNQAIFYAQRVVLDQAAVLARHAAAPLLRGVDGTPAPAALLVDGRAMMTADLQRDVVGFVARRTQHPLVLSALGQHAPERFFTAIPRPEGGLMYLEQDRFYILATRERIVVPIDLACEMVPFDPGAGEFRAHYAGFFDPGWGVRDSSAPGAPAVLEVRPHQDDLILRHGQPICAMAYEVLQEPCARPYGTCGNTYATQDGPRLSKHFAAR